MDGAAIFLLSWLILTCVALLFWLISRKKVAQQKKAIDILETQLNKYLPVIDAEKEAEQILNQARSESLALTSVAAQLKSDAEQELIVSQQNAKGIIFKAEQQAQDIASDALQARDKAKEYEQAVQALKNVIDGYGDQYIITSQSILDGLADEFGFTEAGIKLKEARSHSKKLIKDGLAATCDYAEDYRRKTAIAFVIDAFNGKVDTVLAKTRAENVGKLRQEIEDSYSLVNLNGQAFRNARITDTYKQARLEELRWGAVAVELKELEREEQRAIKEKIREEERARKEYEKAIRDAAKDEAKLQAALEKAKLDMDKASEDQKAHYEQQLAELTAKLAEAETRSQRALSMAQQTRSGHVYVISNIGSFGEDVFKIGMTRRLEPLDRIRELGDASVPFPFDIHAMVYSDDAPTLETALHKKFNELRLNKVNARKEFFRVGLPAIRDLVHEMGVQASFTILAQAHEYRESLAMEKLSKEERDIQLQKLLNTEIEEDEAIEV